MDDPKCSHVCENEMTLKKNENTTKLIVFAMMECGLFRNNDRKYTRIEVISVVLKNGSQCEGK